MSHLSLSLLGTFTATYQNQPLTKFRSSNAQALLIYLTVEHRLGTAVSPRQALMELLWPHTLLKSSQANLRQTLYQLRQAIPDVNEQPLLLTNRNSVQINPEFEFSLDVADFLQIAKSGEIAQLETAVSLYRGAFLEDFHLSGSNPFTNWSQAWQEKCQRTMLETLQTLTRHAIQQNNLDSAEHHARQQLTIDNLHEPGHKQLITILARSHRTHEAITHFEAYGRLLHRELDLTPSPDIITLIDTIRAGELPQITPDITTPTPTPHPTRNTQYAIRNTIPNNLYPPSTPFVGRIRELNELDEWLSSPAVRLINILGPGGIGKTRLAVMTASHQLNAKLDTHSHAPRFPDGVYFVSLAPLQNEEDIIPAIIKAINLKLERPRQAEHLQEVTHHSAHAQLLNHLRDKRMLLVMNNYEHLLGGTRILVDILRAAPAVHILATSRERLQLHGEQVYPLQGLDYPQSTHPPDDESVWQAYTAVQLFLQSARRIRPNFHVTPDEWRFVGQICQWVEGLPLGLELAASWIDMMSLPDIVAEIQQSLDFLETELRDLPPRHRSMRAVFDYTWHRLNPTEQDVLPRLSVLGDGFSRSAAQHITGASLRTLANMVNKSLLRYSKSSDQYEIHALVRQYAAEKLAENSEQETAVRDKHANHYCQWLNRQRDAIKGPQQQTALADIDAAIDNIRAAWDWSVRRKHWHLLAAALETQTYFYWWQGRFNRGPAACKQVLTAMTHNQPINTWLETTDETESAHLLLAEVLVWLGLFAQLTGQMEKANQHLRDSITVLDKLDTTPSAQAIRALAMLQTGYNRSIHNHKQAHTAFMESLSLYESLQNEWGQSTALLALGRTEGRLGAFEAAQQWLMRSHTILEKLGDQRGLADVAALMCRMFMFEGQIAESIEQGQKSVQIVASLGLRTELKQGILSFAMQLNGDIEAGATLQQQCLEAELRRGVQYGLLVVRTAMGHLFAGNYPLAYEQAQRALTLAQNEGRLREQAMASQVLGMAAFAMDDVETAVTHLQDAPTTLYRIGEVAEASWAQGIYADALWVTGKHEDAKLELQQAFETAVSIKSYLSLLFILPPLMRVSLEQGNTQQAARFYHRLNQEPLFAKSPWFEQIYGRILPTTLKTDNASTSQNIPSNLWDFEMTSE